ncbi:MAG: hypothetical protein P8J32_01125, partial [bacterium]|nr:hypothetical protein [bacterium]
MSSQRRQFIHHVSKDAVLKKPQPGGFFYFSRGTDPNIYALDSGGGITQLTNFSTANYDISQVVSKKGG